MIRVCKTILSGSGSGQDQEQAAGLQAGPLRDPAVQLAADPDLTVSVISYDDGRQELEALHTGSPCHTEDTIDPHRFIRQPGPETSRTLSIATSARLQDALTVIRGILRDAAASLRHPAGRRGHGSRGRAAAEDDDLLAYFTKDSAHASGGHDNERSALPAANRARSLLWPRSPGT